MTASAWTRATHPVRRGTAPPLVVAAAILAAACAGALLGERLAAGPEPGTERPLAERAAVLQAGPGSLSLPPGWWAAEPAPGLPRATGARGASGPWTDAVLAVVPASDPSLLPAVVRDGAAPEPRRVVLAGVTPAWRYDALAGPPGAELSVFVVPTTDGVVTFACAARPGTPPDECPTAADQLEVERGQALPPAPEAAARIALPPAVARLNERRRSGRRALAQGRVAAARSIAGAYAEAAATMRPLAAGSAAGLPQQLTGLARAHRALARAHASRHRRAAIAAGARITYGERQLDVLVRDLAPPA